MKEAERNRCREKALPRLKMTCMTHHVLLVDDDPVVRDLVREYLQGNGLAVSVLHDGTGLKRRLDVERPSIVVLDVMMPEQDGISALRELRAAGVSVLLVEQNAQAALAIADRAYVLQTGQVVLSGRAAELRENELIRHAYLGELKVE